MTTTLEHTQHPCQYIGEQGLRPTCTHAALPGRSYCAEHLAVVYKEGTARARRKKDIRVAAAVWDLESEFNAAVEELVLEGYDFEEERWAVVEEAEVVA
jgi:hypothetical protein